MYHPSHPVYREVAELHTEKDGGQLTGEYPNGQNNQQNNSRVTNEDLQKQLNQFTQMIMESPQSEQNEQMTKKLLQNYEPAPRFLT